MGYPTDRRYTNEHEWARLDGDTIVVGITKFATESLGDVVFVELPKPGDTVTKGERFGVVESTKAVSDLFAPLSGTVSDANQGLIDGPEQANVDPYAAWMIKVTGFAKADFDALMDAAAYEKFVAESAH